MNKLLFLVLFISTFSFGQENFGKIIGTVTFNDTVATNPVKVILMDLKTGEIRFTECQISLTDENEQSFTFRHLSRGRYTITIPRQQNFGSFREEEIDIRNYTSENIHILLTKENYVIKHLYPKEEEMIVCKMRAAPKPPFILSTAFGIHAHIPRSYIQNEY